MAENQATQTAGEQSGDPGRTPGAAEGDRETVEQDLEQQNQGDNSKNPPETAQGVNQQSTPELREETGEVVDKQDEWINERV